MSNKRNRTPSEYIRYGLYLYFLGLSLRNVVKALSYLNIIKRSHVTIWNWIQKFHPKKMSLVERKKVSEYIIDETVLKAGSENIWLWIATEPENGQFLAQTISKERNMFVAERFLSSIVRDYGKHAVSTDGGTWYPQACEFLKMEHHIHSSLEKSLIERKIQYIKDRTESFDDYFPCRQKNCKLKHVKSWLNLFVKYHNKEVMNA
jgi:putative transposase